MGLKSQLDRRPMVVALAGPNGAGKSTFYEASLTNTGLYFVNADVLALSLRMDPYAAASLADAVRRQLVARRESFIFETVFSDPVGEKLEFLKEWERAGYTVQVIFIGLSAPEISDERVAMRASRGGHDVPRKKLIERFPRTMKNLKRALVELAKVEDGQGIELWEPTPEWLRVLLS
ncbi:MAG: zeta toxin family protein [Terracidiphilus sp.]